MDSLNLLELDTWEFWSDFGSLPGGERGNEGGTYWFRSGLAAINYNSILGKVQDADRRIAHAGGWGVPWRWTISSTDVEGAEVLAARGFEFTDEWPGMVADIAKLRRPELGAVTVEHVRDEGAYAEWTDVFRDANQMPPATAEIASKAHGWHWAHNPRRKYLLLRLDGEAVATALWHSSGIVAGVYAIGVRRAFQRRGLGALATLVSIAEGAERGAKLAILQATKEGFPVYQKLGFETLCYFRAWRPRAY